MDTHDVRRARGTIAIAWSLGGVAVLGPALVVPEQLDAPVAVIGVGLAALAVAAVFLAVSPRLSMGPWPLLVSELVGIVAIAAVVVAGGRLAGTFLQLLVLVTVKAALHLRVRDAALVTVAVVAVAAGLAVAGQAPASDAWVATLLAAGVAVPAYRYARKVRTSEARLAAQDQWWRASMGGFAHDVRAPLATVIGMAQLLESDPAKVDVAQLAGAIRRGATKVNLLAEGLLDTERVRGGQLVLQQRPVRATELLHRAAADALGQVDVQASGDLFVVCDPDRIGQVLANLLANAFRYGRPPVRVSAARLAGGVIQLTVSDDGDGIDPAEATSLFDRFTNGGETGSTGLGLWVARQFVEAHDGKIFYEPSPSGGASFVVQLPDRTDEAPQQVLDDYLDTLSG